jgi:formate dehydrogenase subunit gamma
MRHGLKVFGKLFAAILVLAVASLTVAGVVGALVGEREVRAQQAQPGETTAGAPVRPSDADVWRAVRQGAPGYVASPDAAAGVLIQSEGEIWRNFRHGPLSTYGAWLILGTIGALALFFAIRGRIRIEHGRSGFTIERFTGLERFTHWLTAFSFVFLAVTGLNILYGRYVLRPLVGPQLFADITLGGKYIHNYLAFAFMVGIVLMLVLWVRYNLPTRNDLRWLAKGGGMFSRGVHPPARKFNAGQKLIFWITVLGGISVSLTGIALMWPFQFAFFSGTFAFLNIFGLGLPADLSPIQEMQLAQAWHAILGLILTAVIIAHIYIGTIGMEGSFDAMGTGRVDENWAREHHGLWVDELEGRRPVRGAAPQPAPAGGDD